MLLVMRGAVAMLRVPNKDTSLSLSVVAMLRVPCDARCCV